MNNNFYKKRRIFLQKNSKDFSKALTGNLIDGIKPRWRYALCMRCKFMDFDKESCDAFPKGIPENIIYGEMLHWNIIEGQYGTYTFTDVGTEIEE